MSDSEGNTITVKLLERDYKVKCPQSKIAELQESANYLNEKMKQINDSKEITTLDRTAVIAGLNISYELLQQRKVNSDYIDGMADRIRSIQDKMEAALNDDITIKG